jgi:hypothetical protein
MTSIEKMAIQHVIATLNGTRNLNVYNDMRLLLDKVEGISNEMKGAILKDNNDAIEKTYNLPIMGCVRWLEALIEKK